MEQKSSFTNVGTLLEYNGRTRTIYASLLDYEITFYMMNRSSQVHIRRDKFNHLFSKQKHENYSSWSTCKIKDNNTSFLAAVMMLMLKIC